MLRLDSKGQSLLVDLAFGVFLFILLFAFVFSQWQKNIAIASKEAEFDEISSRSANAVDVLVSSPGIPSNWFSKAQADINVIGLAKKDRVIDERRLLKFLLLDYNFSQNSLRLSGFDFYFRLFNDNGVDFNYGVFPDSNYLVVSLRRIVDYKGVESVVDFTVFRK